MDSFEQSGTKSSWTDLNKWSWDRTPHAKNVFHVWDLNYNANSVTAASSNDSNCDSNHSE